MGMLLLLMCSATEYKKKSYVLSDLVSSIIVGSSTRSTGIVRSGDRKTGLQTFRLDPYSSTESLLSQWGRGSTSVYVFNTRSEHAHHHQQPRHHRWNCRILSRAAYNFLS